MSLFGEMILIAFLVLFGAFIIVYSIIEIIKLGESDENISLDATQH